MSQTAIQTLAPTLPTPSRPNFDRIARLYRWLEYATLGPLLEQTRNRHLAAVRHCSRALILGDGDGRFTARLLAAAPHLHAEAVDLSASMLRLLARRAVRDRARLCTRQADARTYLSTSTPDLVVTHFFLDCLTQQEADALIARVTPTLAPGALWLVSEFRIPSGLLHWPARLYIGLLYLAFRVLTALRVPHLPDYSSALRRAGFTLVAERRSLFGVLTAELWRHTPPTGASPQTNPSGALPQTKPTGALPQTKASPDNPHPAPSLQLDMTPSPSDSAPEVPLPAARHETDAQPDPEPSVPSLNEPDPGVFRHDPAKQES